MTDRVARCPHGRKARETYGSDDVHAWAWDHVLGALQLGADDSLLDAGCGGGVFLRRALETGSRATGADHSPAMVRLARETTGGSARIVEADVTWLPFADGEFTAVSSIVAFFFFPDPVGALRELRRVLDPARGRLAIYTTAPEAKGTPAAPYPIATRGHFYEDAELGRLALAAGFDTARVTRVDEIAQLLVAHA